MSSEVMIERNVFTDIGYHGLLQLGSYDYQNISISNNYFDGSGITRYWSTSAIFSQGSRNVLISNNEVTRSMGNGIMIKSESLSKDYWNHQGLRGDQDGLHHVLRRSDGGGAGAELLHLHQ